MVGTKVSWILLQFKVRGAGYDLDTDTVLTHVRYDIQVVSNIYLNKKIKENSWTLCQKRHLTVSFTCHTTYDLI